MGGKGGKGKGEANNRGINNVGIFTISVPRRWFISYRCRCCCCCHCWIRCCFWCLNLFFFLYTHFIKRDEKRTVEKEGEGKTSKRERETEREKERETRSKAKTLSRRIVRFPAIFLAFVRRNVCCLTPFWHFYVLLYSITSFIRDKKKKLSSPLYLLPSLFPFSHSGSNPRNIKICHFFF